MPWQLCPAAVTPSWAASKVNCDASTWADSTPDPPMLSTSVTLLERVRRRDDQAAWERFVALYAPLLFRWARRTGLAEADAADLVQEVLVVLVRELPDFTYDAGQNFRGWLKTVTINKCRERQRRHNLAQGAGGGEDPLAGVPA